LLMLAFREVNRAVNGQQQEPAEVIQRRVVRISQSLCGDEGNNCQYSDGGFHDRLFGKGRMSTDGPACIVGT